MRRLAATITLGILAVAVFAGCGGPTLSAPNVVGLRLDEAHQAFEALGIKEFEEKDAFEDRNAVVDSNWAVLGQEPAAGTKVGTDTKIKLTIGKIGEDNTTARLPKGSPVLAKIRAEAAKAVADKVAEDKAAAAKAVADKAAEAKAAAAKAVADKAAAAKAVADKAAEAKAAPTESEPADELTDRRAARYLGEAWEKKFIYGGKVHYYADLRAAEKNDDGSYFLKIGATVKNQYGTEYDAVIEGTVGGTASNPTILKSTLHSASGGSADYYG